MDRVRLRGRVVRAGAVLGVPPRTRSHRRAPPGFAASQYPSRAAATAVGVLSRPGIRVRFAPLRWGPRAPRSLPDGGPTRQRARAVTRTRRNDRRGSAALIEWRGEELSSVRPGAVVPAAAHAQRGLPGTLQS